MVFSNDKIVALRNDLDAIVTLCQKLGSLLGIDLAKQYTDPTTGDITPLTAQAITNLEAKVQNVIGVSAGTSSFAPLIARLINDSQSP